MDRSTAWAVTSKWITILEEYERVKAGQGNLFCSVNDLCAAHRVHRKDIRKYYERWIKAGKERSSLLRLKRGPRVGKHNFTYLFSQWHSTLLEPEYVKGRTARSSFDVDPADQDRASVDV